MSISISLNYQYTKTTNFLFTLSGYKDLFNALGESNSEEWYSSYPIYLPTLVMSGEEDPVGNYGKGVKEVYNNYKSSGNSDTEMFLYENCRHEIHNDTSREQMTEDILKFIAK